MLTRKIGEWRISDFCCISFPASTLLRNIYISFSIYQENMVVLFDQYNLPEDVYKIIFATEQQEVVGKLLINYMWKNGGEIGKTEMSVFANTLHEGQLVIKDKSVPGMKKTQISYNKRQFYDRILTPMKSMGIIEYDLYKKTYRVSDKFNRLMIKIGLMWLREMEKGRKGQLSQTEIKM